MIGLKLVERIRSVSRAMSWRGLAIATLAATALVPAQAQNPPQARTNWSPELAAAFELYYAGDYAETQQMCRQLAAETIDESLLRDADLLEAMAISRMPGRENLNDGRARLTHAAQADPALLKRPECALAYGIASLHLYDTSTALHHLDGAVRAFAEQKRPDREGDALVWLARAWAKHAEWEVAVPGVIARRPNDRADADRIRREQIELLRGRTVALPGGAGLAAEIEFTLADYLLSNSEDDAEGLEVLERLSTSKVAPVVAARALMRLGRRHEESSRWRAAAEAYARVDATDDPALSREADERLEAIIGPRVELIVARQISPGRATPISLKCRNVKSVEVEVRRVDLRGWLESRQGRLADAALPTEGALIALHEFNTQVPDRHDWWNSDSLTSPPTFAAPPGSAVVVARARTSDDRELIVKRLVTVGNLRTLTFIGQQRAALWTTATSPGVNAGEARAWFWMRGSFVPTRLTSSGGVAEFDLPAEARLLRDKRWVCLVQVGEHTALCEGELPGEIHDRPPAVALVAAPQAPAIGDILRVVGFLTEAPNLGGSEPENRQVELMLTDTMDMVCAESVAELSESGAFSFETPITQAMAGKNLRLAVRHAGGVLEQINLIGAIEPQADASSPIEVRCETRAYRESDATSLDGVIEAVSPWPGAGVGLDGVVWLQAVRLPTSDPAQNARFSEVVPTRLEFGADGTATLDQPLAEFRLRGGPVAIGVWPEIRGCDYRGAYGFGQTLIGDAQLHLWLNCDEAGRQVGGQLRFEVGWFDPNLLALGQRPHVVIRRAGVDVAELEISPLAGGLYEGSWHPSAAGEYEIAATVHCPTGEVFGTRQSVMIDDVRSGVVTNTEPLRYSAAIETGAGRRQIRVSVSGKRSEPLLALIANEEPLALREIPELDGAAEFVIPISEPSSNTRLMLIASDQAGPTVLGERDVSPGPTAAPNLELSVAPDPPTAGTTASVKVSESADDDDLSSSKVVTLRLTDLSAAAGGPWAPPSGLTTSPESSGLQCISSSRNTGESGSEAAPTVRLNGPRRLSTRLATAWFELPTLWIDSKTFSQDTAEFDVPLPESPGRYRIVATATSTDGGVESTSLDIDTRRQAKVSLDAPRRAIVGDRTVAGLLVNNHSTETAVVRLELTTDGAISITGPQASIHREWFEHGEEAGCGVLTLPPKSSETLFADIEAVSVGSHKITLTATTESQALSAAAVCRIDGEDSVDEAAATRSRIDLKRMLLALEQPRDAGINAEGAFNLAHWRQTPIDPHKSVPLGQLLLVREEFTLPEALRDISWSQSLPANARTHGGVWEGLREPGARDPMDVHVLRSNASWLGAGFAHVREYVIVAGRPGSCAFPPPIITHGGNRLEVNVVPSSGRLGVQTQ